MFVIICFNKDYEEQEQKNKKVQCNCANWETRPQMKKERLHNILIVRAVFIQFLFFSFFFYPFFFWVTLCNKEKKS